MVPQGVAGSGSSALGVATLFVKGGMIRFRDRYVHPCTLATFGPSMDVIVASEAGLSYMFFCCQRLTHTMQITVRNSNSK
jgi:hypothetical protein